MTAVHDLALVVHVLGWVFWLGTDVGVFVAARYAERGDLGTEARLKILELGMILDRAPRFAVPIVWYTGMVLSDQLGFTLLPLVPTTTIAVVWLVITWGVIFAEPASTSHRAAMVGQKIFYLAVIAGMGLGGSWLLYSGSIPLWLGLKWFGFVIVAVGALLLEKLFAPVIPLFQELAATDSNPELNSRIVASLKPVYPMVLLIYGGTLVAGISGLLKPL